MDSILTLGVFFVVCFGIMLWPEGLVVFLLFISGYPLIALIAIACIGLKRMFVTKHE
ncbi:hypothetical protein HY413_02365 [Candidatus Kaiserbacteria bacterium]|nr:hypothetical protein [Candidatus Kaiserbacteria bacterium]